MAWNDALRPRDSSIKGIMHMLGLARRDVPAPQQQQQCSSIKHQTERLVARAGHPRAKQSVAECELGLGLARQAGV